MSNQYIWLHNNLERYIYNTEDAKALYGEFKAINVLAGESLSEDKRKRLEECYDRFLSMFNNNPVIYKNGLKDYGIETQEYECYFVKSNEGMMPIGYYTKERPVESVLLLNQKAEKQKNRTLEEKHKTIKTLTEETSEVSELYNARKKVKKAGFIRGFIALVTSLMMIWYTFRFFNITNIIDIITSLGNMSRFTSTVQSGMFSMPVFSNGGTGLWFLLLIVHIIFLIVGCKNLKKVRKEFELAYKEYVTGGIVKKADKFIKEYENHVDSSVDEDTKQLFDAARKGGTVVFEQSAYAKGVKKLRSNLELAREYVQINIWNLRGIKSNISIFFMIIIALSCFYSYTILGDADNRADFEKKIYDAKVYFDDFSLRSKKIIQVNIDSCPVYESPSDKSEVKNTLPIWTDLELCEKKMVDEILWFKIRKDTGSSILNGWVQGYNTVAYNGFDTSLFSEIPVLSAEASSHLVGAAEYIADYAIDWNRATSWYDGDAYSSGKGEYITLNLAQKSTVDLIQVFPGNSESEEMYWRNERIKTAKITFSDNESVIYEFDDTFNEAYQTIWLNKPVETDFIKIEIMDTYTGEHLCIGEIHAYGMNR